jgi:iron complex outermembrane receptor protein
VPVSNSGSFVVYPQNMPIRKTCAHKPFLRATPESPPQATGGNVGITSCDPENTRRFRVAQGFGELRMSRTFVRADSGRFADDKAKVFVSLSHTQADKWKGEGGAKKDHMDAAFRWDLNPDNTVLGSVLYNRAVNNNISNVSLAQLNTFGYNYDFSRTFTPGHLPGGTGAQRETGPSHGTASLLNPFERHRVWPGRSLASETHRRCNRILVRLGTSGVHKPRCRDRVLNTTTGKVGAGTDLNGDKDTLDTVIVSRSSVTKTQRPGVTAEVNTAFGNHQVRFGVWYERASHRQTQPAVGVNAEGEPYDIWLQNGQILRPSGTTYQGRDWDTISTAYQFYANDTISLMGDRAVLSLGVRAPTVKRDVTNYANETFATTYNIRRPTAMCCRKLVCASI